MSKLTKLQLDYLKTKLSKIANDKMQYIIKPEHIDSTKKIKLITDKKVELKSLKEQLSSKYNGEQIITLSKKDNVVISYKDYCRVL